jgi:hypothetical protein
VPVRPVMAFGRLPFWDPRQLIIHELHVPCMPIPELESDPPRPACQDRPLTSTGAAGAMKAHRRQSSQVFEALGLVE